MNPASHPGRWLAGLSTAVTAGLLVISCTFTLDQKYISPIQPPPDHTTATIEITDPDFQDPFFLDWTTAFTLKIETDKKFRGAYIEGGESAIQYTFNAGVLGFELNPGHFNDGTHTIIVKVWTSTGSGSLADRNGSESTSAGSSFARSSAALTTCPPMVAPWVMLSAPFQLLHNGVRAVETITASVIFFLQINANR